MQTAQQILSVIALILTIIALIRYDKSGAGLLVTVAVLLICVVIITMVSPTLFR